MRSVAGLALLINAAVYLSVGGSYTRHVERSDVSTTGAA